jgi:2-alkenal reductase
MYGRRKYHLWITSLIITVSLLAGAAFGSVAGYVFAGEAGPSSPSALARPISSRVADSSDLTAVANVALALPERQTLIITQESASVEAVDKVLPGVVTVLNEGNLRVNGSGLVTNNHVIEGAQSLSIVYFTGGVAPATLVGTAPDFDLAVLKVDGPVPGVAEWGDSGELPLGANVIAIGSALGQFQSTVTGGLLSGFNRRVGPLHGLLQTDAAINQGNSGGPLINLGGQVIGVNTLTVRGGRAAAEGLGFAIPSNIARSVARNLIESGKVGKPFLGVQYQELDPWLAIQGDLDVSQGALLEDITVGTPANLAGLKVGDIIVTVNGQQVDDRHPLVSLLLEHVAGETITLEVLRDGKTFSLTITLAERE